MTEANPVRDVLQMLHRDRATWRLRAELDPCALSGLIEEMAQALGIPRDVALRVIESELEVRPLPPGGVSRHATTESDLPPIPGPAELLPGSAGLAQPAGSSASPTAGVAARRAACCILAVHSGSSK